VNDIFILTSPSTPLFSFLVSYPQTIRVEPPGKKKRKQRISFLTTGINRFIIGLR